MIAHYDLLSNGIQPDPGNNIFGSEMHIVKWSERE